MSSDNKKTIMLIGPMGYGKSTTGNKLLNGNDFTIGNDINRVTTLIKEASSSKLTIIDCPGFGDTTDDRIFANQILSNKQYLLDKCPIDCFVLVLKFDCDVCHGFLKAAQQFVKAFGSEAIKSLIVLCIQGNDKRKYSDDDFTDIFRKTDGLSYLCRRNDGKGIYKVNWDNYQPYPNQENDFNTKITYLQKFSSLQMRYSFDLLDKELEK